MPQMMPMSWIMVFIMVIITSSMFLMLCHSFFNWNNLNKKMETKKTTKKMLMW
uniref:ATP synthase F0 subunit 8 n=1 Tax=Endeis spinosa TaxID=136194 RepID=Q535F7_9CHEL|nr:ATP synthase F0 subunit 8 [Endeis spinosa]